MGLRAWRADPERPTRASSSPADCVVGGAEEGDGASWETSSVESEMPELVEEDASPSEYELLRQHTMQLNRDRWESLQVELNAATLKTSPLFHFCLACPIFQ